MQANQRDSGGLDRPLRGAVRDLSLPKVPENAILTPRPLGIGRMSD